MPPGKGFEGRLGAIMESIDSLQDLFASWQYIVRAMNLAFPFLTTELLLDRSAFVKDVLCMTAVP